MDRIPSQNNKNQQERQQLCKQPNISIKLKSCVAWRIFSTTATSSASASVAAAALWMRSVFIFVYTYMHERVSEITLFLVHSAHSHTLSPNSSFNLSASIWLSTTIKQGWKRKGLAGFNLYISLTTRIQTACSMCTRIQRGIQANENRSMQSKSFRKILITFEFPINWVSASDSK